MHAFLIASQSINNLEFEIKNLATEQRAKILPFAMQRIEDTRELKKFVKFSFSEKTAIVIENIDNATPESQNAFLKNLEEPNNNLIYILTASNLTNVLPTIISRCEVIKVSNVSKVPKDTNYKDVLNIKDREEAIKFIENLIYTDHEKDIFKNMENYLNTIKNLKANGNVSLQLTNFVVMLNR